MPKPALTPALAGAAMCLVAMHAAPAHAQLGHTWVSSVGDDVANCDRPTPCASFQGAFAKTHAGGEITCLGSGNFGGLIINKSITINCENAIGSNTGATGSPAFFFIGTAATDVVTLRGLDLDGNGVAFGTAGLINFFGAGVLYVDKVKINNARGPASGIRFGPSGAGRLTVSDTTVTHNGQSTSGAGIVIQPTAGGSARVHLERVSAAGNVFGIVADGTGSTAGINMTVADSVASNNSQDGIIAVTPSGGAPIGVMVKNTKSTNNAIGIRSIGPNVTVRVDGSSVIGNGTGLSFSGGGALLSAGNNMVEANGSNGAFSGPVTLK